MNLARRQLAPLIRSRMAVLLGILVPACVLLSVWMPEIAHYRAPRTPLSASLVAQARTLPAESVLEELRDFQLLPLEGRDATLELAVATRLLEGRLLLPGLPAADISLFDSPTDVLRQLPPGVRLWFVGFAVPDFLLAAYVGTGREEFFVAARDFIANWNRHETDAVVADALVWNDHAIVARVRVLAEFWRVYRSRADYDPDVGRAILEQAARYGHFLASPGHFAFSTNHGVMQNLGLLQLEIAFPTLPSGDEYRRIALDRLRGQLGFFIDGGVIRENSAGYQAFGLELLAMTFRSMTLLDLPVPRDWSDEYVAGLRFLETLRRPDGTLPMIGDTDAASLGRFPRRTTIGADGRSSRLDAFHPKPPGQSVSLHASGGYWVNWGSLDRWPTPADLSQVAVTWATPPAPGHKHADELSVHFWAGGVSWLTSIGYWPYTTEGRGLAESWVGANAPHLAGESSKGERSTSLTSHGSSRRIAAVELERLGPRSLRAQRQVVHLHPDVLLILDRVHGDSGSTTETVWTLPPDVEIAGVRHAGSYSLRSTATGARARLDFIGSTGTEFSELRGSSSPFGGWNVVQGVPKPATAVVVAQPGSATWLATVMTRIDGRAGESGELRLSAEADTDWEATVPTSSGRLIVRRVAHTILVQSHDGALSDTLLLALGPEIGGKRAAIESAYHTMSSEYPRFRMQVPKRLKTSYAVILLFLAQESLFLLVRRNWPAWQVPMRVLSLLCWAGVGLWLHYCFLQSWEIVTPQMG